MAIILPDTPLVTSSPVIAKLHRLFKYLSDDAFTVWHRLTIHPEPGPDFWVLGPDRRCLWIKVSTLTASDIKLFTQSGLFSQSVSRPVEAEHQALLKFGRQCFNEESGPLFQNVSVIVLFPNLVQSELVTLLALADRPAGVDWAGREQLTPTGIAAWVEQHLGQPSTADLILRIRQAFTPEVIIPAQLTVRQPIQRNTTASITPHLLDYDQERVLKTDLDLSAEARATLTDFNLRLVNGVAGSGKSLIIVYRAQLLRQIYPFKSILGLTHNRPLMHDLRSRYESLNPHGKQVRWQTFYQWCRQLWPTERPFPDILGQAPRKQVITRVWHAHFVETAISEQMLQDELDWCKDRLVFSREDYLAVDRTGRGFALTEAQRNKMFTAFESYQTELGRRNQMDWGDVPRQIWRWLQAGQLQLPQNDVILIDEAQFFAPLWFELIKRSLKPKTGYLFLVADPTQGFLKRRQSWTASGLEVRGRVHRLKKSYRTSREILNFATLLYRTGVPEDDDDIVVPDLLDMPSGAFPQIISLTSEQDEITRVVNEVDALIRQGIPKRHLLIIHTDWQGCERLLERINVKLGPGSAIDPKEGPPADTIRVCTLNAATGLESPIVFLVGVHQLFEQEQSIRLSDEERIELIRDNTRKLYMAITRAGQRLVMTFVGDLPSALQALPINGLAKAS